MYVINRDDVVKLMTEHIETMNRRLADSHGMDSNQVEILINQARPELTRINGELFDLLVERGVIRS